MTALEVDVMSTDGPRPASLPEGSRLQRVLDAYRLISADPSSAALAERLLLAAVELTRAEFGAVVVVGTGDAIATTALHRPDLAEPGPWWEVLTERATAAAAGLAVDPAAERAAALTDRLGGTGRLLGTTVRVRTGIYAEVFVGTRNAEHLDAEADLLLPALAELAGTAVENALLHDDAQRSKDWLQASGEIARTLLSEAAGDPGTMLQVILRALHVAEADNVALMLPVGEQHFRVALSGGRGHADYDGYVFESAASAFGQAIRRGASVLADDVMTLMREGFVNRFDFGPVMSTPLVDAHGVRGAIVLCRRRGRPPFTVRDLDLATTFADQLALGLEMDDARLRNEWTTILEDRHRIAQDLHDNVIQRLFATGMGLQSMITPSLPEQVATRLGRYIAELDETIDDIRTRVFDLRDAEGRRPQPATTRFPRIAPDDTAAG